MRNRGMLVHWSILRFASERAQSASEMLVMSCFLIRMLISWTHSICENRHVYKYDLCTILYYISIPLKCPLFFFSAARSSAPGEYHQVMKNLQAHYEDFLQESRVTRPLSG